MAAYITRRDKLAWDQEIEEDFSPGGKHEKTLEKIDAEISPRFRDFTRAEVFLNALVEEAEGDHGARVRYEIQ